MFPKFRKRISQAMNFFPYIHSLLLPRFLFGQGFVNFDDAFYDRVGIGQDDFGSLIVRLGSVFLIRRLGSLIHARKDNTGLAGMSITVNSYIIHRSTSPNAARAAKAQIDGCAVRRVLVARSYAIARAEMFVA